MRILWALILAAVPPQPVQPPPPQVDHSREIMRLLLSNADLVIVGEIENVRSATAREAASHWDWNCQVRVLEVIQGQPPQGTSVRAGIDIVKDHPFTPQKGDKRILFLRKMGSGNEPYFVTTDIRFGVQPAILAAEFKQMAIEMKRNVSSRP